MTAEESPGPVDLAHEAAFRLGPIEVRPPTRELIAGDRREVLEPRIMQVLTALARRRGEVVSRDDLVNLCWGGRAVSEDAINRCIAAVRRLATAHGGFAVETIARVGYRLSETADTSAPTAPAGAGWQAGAQRRRLWLLVGLAVLVSVIAVAGLAVRAGFRTVPSFADTRVAVLPFDVLGGGRDEAALAAGLGDEIQGVLASNQVLALSRTDVLALRSGSSRDAARRLRVGLLVNGTVRREGGTVKVWARVIDAQEHVTLWSRAFVGSPDKSEALEAQVAGRVTEIITWLLSDRYGLGARVDRETLAAYLEAGDQSQNGGDDRQTTIFRQITRRAPAFSYGHSGLAWALILQAMDSPEAGRGVLFSEAKTEALRAQSLDPRNGEAPAGLGALTALSAWKERETLLATGVSRDPDSPTALSMQTVFLADVGRAAEALSMAQRTAAAEPYWSAGAALLAERLIESGRMQEGRAALARAVEFWPDDPIVRNVRFHAAVEGALGPEAVDVIDDPRAWPEGATPEAVAVWRKVVQARRSGRLSGLLEAAQAVRTAAQSATLSGVDAAVALSMLGDVDGALGAASHAFPPQRLARVYGNDGPTRLLFSAAARAMRRDPRFMDLAARLGLADYWVSTGRWPDFCAEADLAYDCRKAALLAIGGRR